MKNDRRALLAAAAMLAIANPAQAWVAGPTFGGAKHLSDLPDFPGKRLLLAAQKRAIEAMGGDQGLRGADLHVIGLAVMLIDAGVLKDGDQPPTKGKP